MPRCALQFTITTHQILHILPSCSEVCTSQKKRRQTHPIPPPAPCHHINVAKMDYPAAPRVGDAIIKSEKKSRTRSFNCDEIGIFFFWGRPLKMETVLDNCGCLVSLLLDQQKISIFGRLNH